MPTLWRKAGKFLRKGSNLLRSNGEDPCPCCGECYLLTPCDFGGTSCCAGTPLADSIISNSESLAANVGRIVLVDGICYTVSSIACSSPVSVTVDSDYDICDDCGSFADGEDCCITVDSDKTWGLFLPSSWDIAVGGIAGAADCTNCSSLNKTYGNVSWSQLGCSGGFGAIVTEFGCTGANTYPTNYLALYHQVQLLGIDNMDGTADLRLEVEIYVQSQNGNTASRLYRATLDTISDNDCKILQLRRYSNSLTYIGAGSVGSAGTAPCDISGATVSITAVP